MDLDSTPELTDCKSFFELLLGQEPKELSRDRAMTAAVLIELRWTSLSMCCD